MKKQRKMNENLAESSSRLRGAFSYLIPHSLLRSLMLLLVVMTLTSVAEKVVAQNPAVIFSDWTLLGEDSNHVDVSYRVVKCDLMASSAVHLKLFNENPVLKNISFSITITNTATGAATTGQHSFVLDPAVIEAAECGTTSPFIIPVPAGYDPSQLSLSITF